MNQHIKRNMKNLKKNQVVIFVIALMLVTAGYLNFTNQQNLKQNLLPTSALADSEQMAAIGDAKLVNANQVTNNTSNSENVSSLSNTTNDSDSKLNSNTTNMQNTNNQETSTKPLEDNTNKLQENQNTNTQANFTSTTSSDNSYFTQSRLDRDSMYSQMLENYQKILETENLETEEKTNAQNEIKRINNEKNAIMIAENLIKTKGFEDVVIFSNNGNVSVIIKAEKLEENQIAQIQNIITRELNVKATKINVSVK